MNVSNVKVVHSGKINDHKLHFLDFFLPSSALNFTAERISFWSNTNHSTIYFETPIMYLLVSHAYCGLCVTSLDCN